MITTREIHVKSSAMFQDMTDENMQTMRRFFAVLYVLYFILASINRRIITDKTAVINGCQLAYATSPNSKYE